jgi:hypothetical protein
MASSNIIQEYRASVYYPQIFAGPSLDIGTDIPRWIVHLASIIYQMKKAGIKKTQRANNANYLF